MTNEALNGDLKVAVLNINPGVVSHEFFGSVLNLMAHDVSTSRHISCIIPQVAGGLVHIYRNTAIEAAYASGFEWDAVLFIDSDMMFPPDILDRLIAHLSPERPVVCAIYTMNTQDGPKPSVCYYREDENGVLRMAPCDIDEVPEDELIECDASGCGFMLIHRSLLDEMHKVYGSPMPWFDTEIVNGIICGEDYTFGLRCQKLGYKTYVHSGIEAEHVSKRMVLNLELARKVKENAAADSRS